MPFLDRRPVWLSRELRRRVEDAMGLALREVQTTDDPGRARMLRRFVLPHYIHVLDDHRRAERIRAHGGAGYRELEGSTEDQLVQVSRAPVGLLRTARGERRTLTMSERPQPLRWTGPFPIAELLHRCLDDDQPWPPDSSGVYLVTRHRWSETPTREASPLYLGGNTGESARFCTRIGDLIADTHGFWGASTGHHSGGQSLYRWCTEQGVRPGALWLGWATREPWCGACAEVELARALVGQWDRRGEVGLLNVKRPPRCGEHGVGVR